MYILCRIACVFVVACVAIYLDGFAIQLGNYHRLRLRCRLRCDISRIRNSIGKFCENIFGEKFRLSHFLVKSFWVTSNL